MKETGILFTPDNADKSNDGRKTNTRRPLKGDLLKFVQDFEGESSDPSPLSFEYVTDCERVDEDIGKTYLYTGILMSFAEYPEEGFVELRCPYGTVGDRLYLKEPHYRYGRWMKNGKTSTGRQKWRFWAAHSKVKYLDNPPRFVGRKRDISHRMWWKRSPLFMEKKHARHWYEITGLTVERLQDISEEHALAEGIAKMENGTFDGGGPAMGPNAVIAFMRLWESIHGPGSWAANPWVWSIKYRKVPA